MKLALLLLLALLPVSLRAEGFVPRSGSTFLTPETLAQQNDDFLNPGMFWVEQGAQIFAAQCASCHSDQLKGVATQFPKIINGELRGIEAQINACRREHSALVPLAYESEEMLSLSAYINHQSRGQPQAPSLDDPLLQDAFARGEAYFYQKRGQMDLSCASCHEANVGAHLRAETITQGQINGFPLYRQQWQSMGTVQRILQWCNENIRAEPLAADHPDYLALELYLRWRGRGLLIETPAIRR